MLAGNERDLLLRLAAKLGLELGVESGEQWAESVGIGAPQSAWSVKRTPVLPDEDEGLIATLREALGRVAAGVWAEDGNSADEPRGAVPKAIVGALEGAEFVMRGELVRDNGRQLLMLMPSFVFLVVVPVVDQERALELSRRTGQLVNRALRDR